MSLEYVTPSGIVLSERAAFPRDANTTPRDNPPNNNPPIGTVGPTVPSGFGDTHALYPAARPPLEAQAWAGWPIGWAVPSNLNSADYGNLVGVVGTCADLIARTIGDFPLVVARGNNPVEPQPPWVDNVEPLVYTSSTEWVKTTALSILMRGEAFIVATARNAENYPVRWITLNPDSVEIRSSDAGIEYTVNNHALDRADVLHVTYQRWPGGLHGIGPLQWAARHLISARALEQYAADLASRGGVPWAVLKHPNRLSSTQAQELREEWVTGAATRYGAPAILSGGIELEMLTMSPKDMALVELLEFDEQRIAAAFGVPPILVGLPAASGMNYSSTTMLLSYFHLTTAKPFAGNLARALSNWALPRGTACYFDADEFVEGAFLDHVSDWNSLVQSGIMTIDEVRAIGKIPARARIAEDSL